MRKLRDDGKMENGVISLEKFDKKFYESIRENKKIVVNENGKFYTIVYKNKKAGIVGYLPSIKKSEGFVQIILLKKFRGKNLVKMAEEKLVKKHHLKKLYATMNKDNIASIKSHEKIGFKKLPMEKIIELKQKRFLKINQIRLFKNYL